MEGKNIEYRFTYADGVEDRLDSNMRELIAQKVEVILAPRAVALGSPAAAVLVGTPFQAIASDELVALQQFAAGVETLFIKQSEDPGGSAASLSAGLGLVRGEVASVPGSDHMYSDTFALVTAMGRWKHRPLGL